MQNPPKFDREWIDAVLRTFFPTAHQSHGAAAERAEAPSGSNNPNNGKASD